MLWQRHPALGVKLPFLKICILVVLEDNFWQSLLFFFCVCVPFFSFVLCFFFS